MQAVKNTPLPRAMNSYSTVNVLAELAFSDVIKTVLAGGPRVELRSANPKNAAFPLDEPPMPVFAH